MATFESSRGRLECTWTSSDDNIMLIIHYMAMIWKNRAFPNGYIYSCRPCMDRLDSKPLRYALVVRTPYNRAKTIDWGKEEWTVNIVGEPQLKIKGIKGILIGDGTTWGHHIGWDITFYVDVLDVVKPENKSDENKNDTYKIGEDTMSVKYMIQNMIQFNRCGGFTETELESMLKSLLVHYECEREEYVKYYKKLTPENKNDTYKIGGNTMNNHEIETAIREGYTYYQRNIIKEFLLRNGLLSNTNLEEVRNIRRDLRPSPKKVIYNGPATIVIFEDGSKTVVKLQEGEQMDREKAVYAAICKRMFGSNKNRSNWLDMLKPLMKEADEAWRVKSEANALNNDIKKSAELESEDLEPDDYAEMNGR